MTTIDYQHRGILLGWTVGQSTGHMSIQEIREAIPKAAAEMEAATAWYKILQVAYEIRSEEQP